MNNTTPFLKLFPEFLDVDSPAFNELTSSKVVDRFIQASSRDILEQSISAAHVLKQKAEHQLIATYFCHEDGDQLRTLLFLSDEKLWGAIIAKFEELFPDFRVTEPMMIWSGAYDARSFKDFIRDLLRFNHYEGENLSPELSNCFKNLGVLDDADLA